MPFHWDLNFPPPDEDFVILESSFASFNPRIERPTFQPRLARDLRQNNSPRNVRRAIQPRREIDLERTSGAMFFDLSNSKVHGGNAYQSIIANNNTEESQNVELGSPQAVEKAREISFKCPICLAKMQEETSTKCGHIFCKECIIIAIASQGKCPTCRRKTKIKDTHRIYLPKAAYN